MKTKCMHCDMEIEYEKNDTWKSKDGIMHWVECYYCGWSTPALIEESD